MKKRTRHDELKRQFPDNSAENRRELKQLREADPVLWCIVAHGDRKIVSIMHRLTLHPDTKKAVTTHLRQLRDEEAVVYKKYPKYNAWELHPDSHWWELRDWAYQVRYQLTQKMPPRPPSRVMLALADLGPGLHTTRDIAALADVTPSGAHQTLSRYAALGKVLKINTSWQLIKSP